MAEPLSSVLVLDDDAVLDVALDWADWLAVGETISTATWACSPSSPSIILGSPAPSIVGGTKPKVWVTGVGATVGTLYGLTCHITTSAGRIDDRTVRVRVKER